MSSVVYFITYENGPIKIGVATDVKKRLSGLQTGCPFKLFVLATMAGDNSEEYKLHNKFQHLRLNGEWFDRGDDLLLFIDNNTDKISNSDAPLSSDAYPDVAFSDLEKEEIKRKMYRLKARVNSLKRDLEKYREYGSIETYNYKSQREIVFSAMCLYMGQNKDFLKSLISSAILDVFGIIKRLDESIDQMSTDLAIYHKINWHGYHETKRDVRRIVDRLFGIHWMDSKELLFEDSPRCDVDSRSDALANKLIQQSWDESLVNFKPINFLTDAQNEHLKYLKV